MISKEKDRPIAKSLLNSSPFGIYSAGHNRVKVFRGHKKCLASEVDSPIWLLFYFFLMAIVTPIKAVRVAQSLFTVHPYWVILCLYISLRSVSPCHWFPSRVLDCCCSKTQFCGFIGISDLLFKLSLYVLCPVFYYFFNHLPM